MKKNYRTINVSYSNIQAALETFLRAIGEISDNEDVNNIVIPVSTVASGNDHVVPVVIYSQK